MSNTSLQGLLITILILVTFVIVIGSLYFAIIYGDWLGTTGFVVLLGCFMIVGGSVYFIFGGNNLLYPKNLEDAVVNWSFLAIILIGLGCYLTGMYKAYKNFRNNRESLKKWKLNFSSKRFYRIILMLTSLKMITLQAPL